MGVGNHIPIHTRVLLGLDKTKFNGMLSIAYLYVLLGCISKWLINLY